MAKKQNGEEPAAKIISTQEDFREFIQSQKGIRRWYISRIFSESETDPYVDLYFSTATEEGTSTFKGMNEEEFRSLSDKDEWWNDEDFDTLVHLQLSEFIDLLMKFGDFPEKPPLEEGMVFLERSLDEKPQFIPFSYQARDPIRELYRRLVGVEAASLDDREAEDLETDVNSKPTI